MRSLSRLAALGLAALAALAAALCASVAQAADQPQCQSPLSGGWTLAGSPTVTGPFTGGQQAGLRSFSCTYNPPSGSFAPTVSLGDKPYAEVQWVEDGGAAGTISQLCSAKAGPGKLVAGGRAAVATYGAPSSNPELGQPLTAAAQKMLTSVQSRAAGCTGAVAATSAPQIAAAVNQPQSTLASAPAPNQVGGIALAISGALLAAGTGLVWGVKGRLGRDAAGLAQAPTGSSPPPPPLSLGDMLAIDQAHADGINSIAPQAPEPAAANYPPRVTEGPGLGDLLFNTGLGIEFMEQLADPHTPPSPVAAEHHADPTAEFFTDGGHVIKPEDCGQLAHQLMPAAVNEKGIILHGPLAGQPVPRFEVEPDGRLKFELPILGGWGSIPVHARVSAEGGYLGVQVEGLPPDSAAKIDNWVAEVNRQIGVHQRLVESVQVTGGSAPQVKIELSH